MATSIPELRKVDFNSLYKTLDLPSLKIKSDEGVEAWKSTRSYQDFGLFLRRLNESVIGHDLPWNPEFRSQPVERLLSLLQTIEQWIDEIPPLTTPQRFGNLAFRTWGRRLEERVDSLLGDLCGPDFSEAIPFVKPYLISSFGNFVRMDYGTGHETSFALFLLCLTLVRFFKPEIEEERDIVLNVFRQYLQVCWKLQDVYKLEPAGSHGVWGLDDYCFLPYVFGSGELRGQASVPVSTVLRRSLPPTNLYFMAITRIHALKTGPFHEHSSQLHSIAAGVPNWGKVNSGLFKMYEAEVLGKRVVVQHIPLGGLLEWVSSDSGKRTVQGASPSPNLSSG